VSSPLDAITYNQEAGYLPINLVAGDDLSVSISLPFDITLYTFAGSVLDSFGSVVAPFTVTTPVLTPFGTVVITLTDLQTATIPTGATYYVQWTVGGLIRTFLSGPIVAVPR
jgi:hypothetical protein